MTPGSTFHIEKHLWIVVSVPAADGSVAMVNLTSHRPPCDETCILNVGDHPFVRHKTIVAYGFSKLVPAAAHREVMQMPRGANVGRRLLERIQRGAIESLATPQKVQAAIQATLTAAAGKK